MAVGRVNMEPDEFIPTRSSLLSRLKNWDNQDSWREFFDTYYRLLYSFARKAGLDDATAQDAVQETIVCVAKQMPGFQYDRRLGSFKGWLRQIVRRRVTDQLREHYRAGGPVAADSDEAGRAWAEAPAAVAPDLDALWDQEWRDQIAAVALERVKRRVRPEQFQMFDFAVLQNWPARKVAQALGATLIQVYMARHRVGKLLKKEARRLERNMI